MSPTPEEIAVFERFVQKADHSIRDLDIDAFADGILAHRNGLAFHENPDGMALTMRRISWAIGWNERALSGREPDKRP